ncbi:hypothetical protein [Hymenobacter actinosclerus]|uniref:SpoIIAA-like n=1 Tax=Hymenobacter actinosclerus TaxID=82805 RepID=A0A1H9ZA25_9BACT|nr:hypothetical protein [Hymenobacter actinosclerus]SES78179.1 hypothetical protein SAMN04487998_0245 [Hymenobacter actinosclerus]
MTPVFANDAGELLAHPAGYALLRYRPGATDVEALAALLTRMGRLLVQRRWSYLLSDALELPTLPPACKDWMVTEWIGGRIERPPVVHVAVVQPAAVLARLSTYEMQAQAQGRTRYYHFADEPAAHAFVVARLGG